MATTGSLMAIPMTRSPTASAVPGLAVSPVAAVGVRSAGRGADAMQRHQFRAGAEEAGFRRYQHFVVGLGGRNSASRTTMPRPGSKLAWATIIRSPARRAGTFGCSFPEPVEGPRLVRPAKEPRTDIWPTLRQAQGTNIDIFPSASPSIIRTANARRCRRRASGQSIFGDSGPLRAGVRLRNATWTGLGSVEVEQGVQPVGTELTDRARPGRWWTTGRPAPGTRSGDHDRDGWPWWASR